MTGSLDGFLALSRRGVAVVVILTAVFLISPIAHRLVPSARPARAIDEVTIAFIADSGYGNNFRNVLNLIKSEGADAVVHLGDFDYVYDADGFFAVIDSVLGSNYPYFIIVGNHDVTSWPTTCTDGDGCYARFARDRLNRLGITPDDPNLNDQMYSISYQGIKLVFAGQTAGAGDSTYAPYIDRQLASDTSAWRICAWHKNQQAMQVGSKTNEMGWSVYETCRSHGAIIATAHEHSYHRTRTLIDMDSQTVDPAWRDANALRVAPGATFVFVSGLGGKDVRNQDRCLPTTFPYGCKGEWASIYTTDQGARPGALFITFNVGGDSTRARGYFKNIDGQIIDDFTITRQSGVSPTATPTPTRTPTRTPTHTPNPGAALPPGYYEDNSGVITYSGTWSRYSNSQASGGGYTRTSDSSAQASFSFDGTRLTIYRTMSTSRGPMQVCIDGTCQTVSNDSSSTQYTVPVVFNVSAGTHTVVISHMGQEYIDLDAIRIEGGTSGPTNTPHPTDTPPPTAVPGSGTPLSSGYYEDNSGVIAYAGTWSRYSNSQASGGGYMRTSDSSAQASFSFDGTRLTIYRTMSTSRGPMQVCIDGACQTVSNDSSTTQYTVPIAFNVSVGTHSVLIRHMGQEYIDIDAVRIESGTTP